MKVVLAPAEILRQDAQPVTFSGPKLAKIITEMRACLLSQTDPEGVGLAANQVGLPYKLFLARFTTKKGKLIRVFINPEIADHSKELQKIDEEKTPLEGCLSLPRYYGIVKRWQWLVLRFQDENLQTKEEKFENFPAVVIQHEMDHLSGRIFVERILEQKGNLYRVTGKDKKGKETWEKVEI